MSTSSLAVSLLLLSLLLSEAQGIRLEKGFISVGQENDNIQVEETTSIKTNNVASCKDGGKYSSSSGSTRKLISATSSSTSTTTASKNEKNNARNNRADPEAKGEKVTKQLGGEDGNVKAMSSTVSKHREAVDRQHYPDLIDMTEMDYSPARRKPPIHN